ncbi:carcinine transporter-like [Zerene cesonia]|uniref:carcinine transporter-like n=1 Tax=Zerene cesonia TaxID=33412 RepID=UPI0018E50A89|nr:carcinine transporter-like [Zerene cesonia]
MSPKEESDNIGSALEAVITSVGEIGLYQRILFIGMLPFGFAWAFTYFVQMFITATPQEHWCRVPELASLDLELRRHLSVPSTGDYDVDSCMVFDANWTHVLETLRPPETNTPLIPCQNGWEFIFEDIPYSTVVSEREWVCDKASLVPWAQSISFLGSIVGGILCGTLADRYGRLPVLILANALGVIGNIASMFTTGFWDFSVCRFIAGMCVDSCFILIFILVLEYVGTKYRTWVANLSIAFFFGGGCILLPWIALWVSDWKLLMIVTSSPMIVGFLAPFVVPESARWLVSKGRIDKAMEVLKRFEKINGNKIPQNVMDQFVQAAKCTKVEDEGIALIFKTAPLRRMVIFLIFTFISVAVMFDSIIRLSENLGLDFFVTFSVASATELPSIVVLLLLLDRLGRRWLVFAPMMAAGALCLITAFVPRGVISVSLAVVARFFNNMSYLAITQWTLELMPTVVRASGASFVHISAFAAVIVTPFIVYSDRAWEGLSLIIVGVVGLSGASLAGASLALVLPETKGKRMPQTMEEWEVMAQSQPYKK